MAITRVANVQSETAAHERFDTELKQLRLVSSVASDHVRVAEHEHPFPQVCALSCIAYTKQKRMFAGLHVQAAEQRSDDSSCCTQLVTDRVGAAHLAV